MLRGFVTLDNFLLDWLYAKWCIMLCISAFIFLAPTWKKSKILYTFLMWMIVPGIFTIFLGFPLDGVIRKAARPDMVFWMLTLFAGVGFSYKVNADKFSSFLSALFYLNVVLTFLSFIFTVTIGGSIRDAIPISSAYSGIYYNASLSGTLLAVLFAFRLKMNNGDTKKDIRDIILAALCFAYYKTSMGVAAFMFGLYVTYFIRFKSIRVYLTLLLGLAISALYLQQGAELFSPSMRINMWRRVLDIMLQSDAYYMVKGYGHGSYSAFAILIYAKDLAAGREVNIQLHSDILQTIFETGWLGIALWMGLIADIFRKSLKRKEYWLIYFVSAWFISSCGNFPKYLAIEHFAFFTVINFIYFKKSEGVLCVS